MKYTLLHWPARLLLLPPAAAAATVTSGDSKIDPATPPKTLAHYHSHHGQQHEPRPTQVLRGQQRPHSRRDLPGPVRQLLHRPAAIGPQSCAKTILLFPTGYVESRVTNSVLYNRVELPFEKNTDRDTALYFRHFLLYLNIIKLHLTNIGFCFCFLFSFITSWIFLHNKKTDLPADDFHIERTR